MGHGRSLLAVCILLSAPFSHGADPATDADPAMGTSASIRSQYEVDSSPKDYKLTIPFIDSAFGSWGEL